MSNDQHSNQNYPNAKPVENIHPGEQAGCRVSNRHPVNSETASDTTSKVLAYGIDSLYLSMDVQWIDREFFELLEEKQKEAKSDDEPKPIDFYDFQKVDAYTGMLQPYGRRGYQWIIEGKEYLISIGNWLEPKARPSILVEIRSEALWHMGPKQAVDRIVSFIDGAGGRIQWIKPSRVDLCADTHLCEGIWNLSILDYQVTYAKKYDLHMVQPRIFQGITIGRGKMLARLYDKPAEIKDKTHKIWIYDIWGIDQEPDEGKIIRTEFQIRREILKELGIDTIADLWTVLPNLWAYCTKNWLKFMDNPGEHHDNRTVLCWWETIQDAFQSDQKACPLVRCKALCTEQEKHFAQTYGCFTSFIAASMEKDELSAIDRLSFFKALDKFVFMTKVTNKSGLAFSKNIQEKRTKIDRHQQKILDIISFRARLGLPDNLTQLSLATP